MKLLLLSAAAAAFVLTRTVQAAESAPSPAPATAATEAPAETEKPALPRYELKNKSSFSLVAGTRAPFWPIGWVKRKSGAPVEVVNSGAKLAFDAKNFNVTSILLGPPALAVVNGRAYEEGQFLRTPRVAGAAKSAASAPRIRVYRITDGQVWLQWEDHIINVALKRPELNDRKIEEELLNEDRDEEFVAPSVSKR